MDFSWDECPKILSRNHSISLVNQQNDCFMNAVLQFVFHTPQLVRHIKNKRMQNKCKDCNKCVYCIVIKYLDLLETQAENLDPTELKDFVNLHFPKRIPNKQEDAHEMLTFLLDELHTPTCFLATKAKPWRKEPVKEIGSNQLLKGSMISCIKCTSCSAWHTTKNDEKFRELSLNLQRQAIKKGKDNTPKATLEDYIKSFFNTEPLNGYICQGCEKKTMYRKYYLNQAPSLLVIQLKRFDSTGKKDFTDIEIPFDLDIDEYFWNAKQRKEQKGRLPAKYKLYGYISHLGAEIKSGHYTSTFLGYDTNWYLYDNETVSLTYPETASASQPYLLFYYREGIKARLPKVKPDPLIDIFNGQTSQVPSHKSRVSNQSKTSLNTTRTSLSSQSTSNEPMRQRFGDGWVQTASASTGSQKRKLADSSVSDYGSQEGPSSSKQSYDPWGTFTEGESDGSKDDGFHKSDDYQSRF